MASSVPNQKKAYPSNAQKARLVALLEADEELRAGKFSSSFTKKVAEIRWKSIQIELNAIPGAKKEWTEWRKSWQDMRSKSKKKNSLIMRNTTGGGPPPPPLTENDEAVLRIINPNSLVGHADSRESIVVFEGILSEEPLAEQASSSKDPYQPSTADRTVQQETPQNKENIGLKPRKKIIKKRKNIEDNLKIVIAYKEALTEKNRLLAEKNELQRFFFRTITEQIEQQNNILARIAEQLSNRDIP